ncbi:phage baseplate plug family protein [Dethiothermospora halolimnae]|uniref:phage baseplate plug family protein n=1 Tax=Dethiothermospora halolimnae TaxID=3114390 RepID=UPI003CCC04C1
MKYIDIDKESIPYKFDMQLKNETYTFEVFYNSIGDYFTMDLYKNEKPIVLGEKVIYGRPLFSTYQALDIPKVLVYPYDFSEGEKSVGYDNFNDRVFLYLVDTELLI